MDLGEQRALQDWYIKLGLQQVSGVAEVASFGGFQKQYEVSIDPYKLVYFDIPLMDVTKAISANNRDAGGGTYELGGSGYMIRGLGYFENEQQIADLAVGTYNAVPIRLSDVATVQMSSETRLGITEQNGMGEVVGGIVVMRYGENAKEVIDRVKLKMEEMSVGLPEDVSFRVAYDRSELINAAVSTLKDALWQEIVIVALVVLLFMFHFKSAAVVIVTIPLSVLIGFILMQLSGVSLNIMSFGGIALAIGDLVDAGIVMVENTYRRLLSAVR
jgi:Cu(I)/Ag(I) efflux system membrane protein CusA/SilA